MCMLEMRWESRKCRKNLKQSFHVDFIDVNFDESKRIALHHAIESLQKFWHGRNWNPKWLNEKNQLSWFQIFQRCIN